MSDQTIDEGLLPDQYERAESALSELVALAERVEVADERHRIDLAAVKEQRDRAEAAEAALADMRRALEEIVLMQDEGHSEVFSDMALHYSEIARRALAAAGPAPEEGQA